MNILSKKQLVTGILALIFLVSCLPKSSEVKQEKESKQDKKVTLVELQTVQAETFRHFFNVQANVQAVKQATISPETGGQVRDVLVKDGERVCKGQLLVKLNTAIVEGQLATTQSQLQLAEITYNKQKDLWLDQHIGSEIQYLQSKTQYESLQTQVKTLQAQMNMSNIRAPFNGIVDKVYVKKGEMASPGMPVVEFVNLSEIKLVGDVSEIYLSAIEKGDSVQVSFSTYPDMQLKSTIYRTGNIINPTNRTFELEVRVKNEKELLKPNMISSLKLEDYKKENAFVVPSIIIKKDFEKEFIFVVEKNDSSIVARKRYVVAGRSFKDQTVIKEGLKVGESVIIAGYNLVSDGTLVSFKK